MNKINVDNLPKHVAIVPDANRRWAEQRGLAPWRGHIAGAKITEEIIEEALDLGIKCLSFWGGSWNNLTKRPNTEIKALFRIYESYFKKLLRKKEIHEYQVKVNVLGRWSEVLPQSGVKAANNLMKATKNYDKKILNFFIAYNGTDEMIAAIKSIAQEARENRNFKITPKVLEDHLWTRGLPLVDLLIRTGSHDDPHNSAGFMMWLTSNVQYYFTNVMYPDFGKDEFNKAVNDFINRPRRFGK